MSVAPVLKTDPLDRIIETCINCAQTQDEIDAYRKLLEARSQAIYEIAEKAALAEVLAKVAELLPSYRDIIESIHRHRQSITHVDPMCAMYGAVPFFFGRHYD
jgi:hypothetical protein